MSEYRIEGPFVVYADGTRLPIISGGIDGDSKQKTTQTSIQTRAIAPPTPAELAAQAQAEAALRAYEQGIQQLQQSPAYSLAQRISEGALGGLADYTSGRAPLVDPYTQSLVNQAMDYQRQRGLQDLKTAASQAAAMRGMTIGDSPIGNPYLQNVTDFGAQLAAMGADRMLNLGQQRIGNLQAVAPIGLNLQEQISGRQMNLGQAANQFRDALANYRLNAAPVTTTSTQFTRGRQPGAQTFGQVAGGIGNLLQGFGTLSHGLTGKEGLFPSLGWGKAQTIPSTPPIDTTKKTAAYVPPRSWFG